MFNQLSMRDSHAFLGRTGLKVSRICLGSMNFGPIDENMGSRPGQLNELEAHALLDSFASLGGNFIETADFYPWFGKFAGASETIIGNWLVKQERERFILMTKIRMPTDASNVNACGLSRQHIVHAVDACLARLRTSYIDVLQLHGWDETVEVFETLRHLDDLVTAGKIMHIGVGDLKGWQLQKFVDAARKLHLHRCVLYEGEYNLLSRGVEWEVGDVCRNDRIAFLAYSPFKYGYLTPAYDVNSTAPLANSRIEAASARKPNLAAMAENFYELLADPTYKAVLQACAKISRKSSPNLRQNMTLNTTQIALLWLLQKGVVTSVVVGCQTPEELEELMRTSSTPALMLTHNEMNRLNRASNTRLQYPYNVNLASIAGYKMTNAAKSASATQMSLLRNYIQVPAFLARQSGVNRASAAPRKPKITKKQRKARKLQNAAQPVSEYAADEQAMSPNRSAADQMPIPEVEAVSDFNIEAYPVA